MNAMTPEADNLSMNEITPESKSFRNERVRFCESRKSSMSLGSGRMSDSPDGICSSFSNLLNKPHKINDPRRNAIKSIKTKFGDLGSDHFRLLKHLGRGDIGEVKLAQLRGTRCFFAVKIVDKDLLEKKNKMERAEREKEILSCLDHPFLPTLYAHYETEKCSCLVMEFCSGGDLHMLRQLQPRRRFSESSARFYATEVLLALEYLHMMGIIYRDLKPENVLVRDEGHIMLSDFDLSLRCLVSPSVIRSASSSMGMWRRESVYCMQPTCVSLSSCFVPAFLTHKPKKQRKPKSKVANEEKQVKEVIVEPISARSMSFVGTHEYLAPEMMKEEGHGSAVDWWSFGIFLYELLYGKTPFRGADNRETLANVVEKPLNFPQNPSVSSAARDLITGLLVKDPQHRLGYQRGAAEIKQHAFFRGTNWALIRSTTPPQIPTPLDLDSLMKKDVPEAADAQKETANSDAKSSESYVEFEFF